MGIGHHMAGRLRTLLQVSGNGWPVRISPSIFSKYTPWKVGRDKPKGFKWGSSLFLGHACIILGVVKPNTICYGRVWFGLFKHCVLCYGWIWHGSYILFSVRFRTDSSSVRKKILETFHKIFRTESSSVRKKLQHFCIQKFRTESSSVRNFFSQFFKEFQLPGSNCNVYRV